MGILTVAKDGSLSTFGPELSSSKSELYQDFVIGNVLKDRPVDVAVGEAFEKLRNDVMAGRLRCRQTCVYYSLCGGGYQSNRIAEHGSLLATETTTCRLHRQVLTDVVIDELSRESAGMTR